MVPLSVRVPAVVLFKPTLPPSAALAVPACMSKAVVLVNVPLLIVPPVCCTPAKVLLKPPRFKLPPLTISVPPLASWSAALRARVPALTVVVPV